MKMSFNYDSNIRFKVKITKPIILGKIFAHGPGDIVSGCYMKKPVDGLYRRDDKHGEFNIPLDCFIILERYRK